MDSDGTIKSPFLVRFVHHGSNFHRAASGDNNGRFVVADPSEQRAKPVDKKPEMLGLAISHKRGDNEIAKEQEQRWIDLALYGNRYVDRDGKRVDPRTVEFEEETKCQDPQKSRLP